MIEYVVQKIKPITQSHEIIRNDELLVRDWISALVSGISRTILYEQQFD